MRILARVKIKSERKKKKKKKDPLFNIHQMPTDRMAEAPFASSRRRTTKLEAVSHNRLSVSQSTSRNPSRTVSPRPPPLRLSTAHALGILVDPPSSHFHNNTSNHHNQQQQPLDAATVRNARRLNRQLRERFASIKAIMKTVKKTELCNVTTSVLAQWGDDITKLVNECDDLIAALPSKVLELEVSVVHSGEVTPPDMQSISPPTMLGASVKRGGGGMQPRPPPHLTGGPLALDESMPFLANSTVVGGTATLRRDLNLAVTSNVLPDVGRTEQLMVMPQDHNVDRTILLASGLHMCLDGCAKAIGAEKASIALPVRGNVEELRSVSSVGFENDEPTRRRSHMTPEVMAMKTGIMIVCSEGTNPPVDMDLRNALQYFQSQATAAGGGAGTSRSVDGSSTHPQPHHNSLDYLTSSSQQSNLFIPEEAVEMMKRSNYVPQMQDSTSSMTLHPNAPGGGAGAGIRRKPHRSSNERMVTSVRSKYWSKLVCPIRLNASTPILGVVTFLNKDQGNANFSTEDEAIVVGAAATLAGLLSRLSDVDLLARAFQRRLNIPPFPKQLLSGVSIPGQRGQLIYRTKESALSGKEAKIITDGRVERLDSHTPFMSVAEYILKMQSSWRDAVLLNAALRKAHEERTRVVTSLLLRARTSEYCNEVLQKERIAMIPDDDSHNAQFFTDYANFKKLKASLPSHLLAEGAGEEGSISAAPSEAADPSRYPRSSSGAGGGGGGVDLHSLSSASSGELDTAEESQTTVTTSSAAPARRENDGEHELMIIEAETLDIAAGGGGGDYGGVTPPVASAESSVTNSNLLRPDGSWKQHRRRSSSQARSILFGKEVLPAPLIE